MYRQSEKKLVKQQYARTSSTCPDNMVNLRPTNGWDLLASLGHPCKFQPVSHLGSVTAWHSSSGRQPNCGVEQRAPHDFAAHGFCHSAPAVWNSLPETVLDSSSLTLFKSRLKPHLFHLAYNDWHELTCSATASEVTTLWRYRNECIMLLLLLYSAGRPLRWALAQISNSLMLL